MNKKIFIAAICAAFVFFGCKKTDPAPEADKELEELVEYVGTFTVDYGNDAATPVISGSVENVTVSNIGANVTVKSTQSGVVKFILQGKTTNGSFKIYSDTRFAIYLNNADITSKDSCAINSQSSKRLYLVLPASTESRITDGTGYPADKEEPKSGGEDKKGAIFSEGQIITSGTGKLQITGRNKHAIASDEYLRVRAGEITIADAASDGIHVKDYYLQEGGKITLTKCTSDALQVTKGYFTISNGELTLTPGDDGIVCDYGKDPATDTDPAIDPTININGGTVTITAMSGKGLYAYKDINVNGGTTTVTCKYKSKCCVVEKGQINKNGGTLNLQGGE